MGEGLVSLGERNLGPGGDTHIRRTGVLVVPFRGLRSVLVALRVFNVKRSTARAFAVPFRGKKYDEG